MVVDAGTIPAEPIVQPVLPLHRVVGIFGGGNDDDTILLNNDNGYCVNGFNGSRFGQVFFCNTQNLFASFHSGGFSIPALGVSDTGEACPTVRSFQIVDQDQSDNVQSTYIASGDGRTAQDTFVNRSALGTFSVLRNPSDNRLLTNFVDPSIGCTPWRIPSQDDISPTATQLTDELQAGAYQMPPIALIPLTDPMTGNKQMTDKYRVNVDQHPVNQNSPEFSGSGTLYCQNLKAIAPPFLSEHASDFTGRPSPEEGVDLNTFINDRYSASLQLLNC